MSAFTTRHCRKGSHRTDVAHRSRPETLRPCRRNHSWRTPSPSAPPFSCLSTEVPGRFPFRLPPSNTGGRRHVPIPRAARIRKRSRWADHSEWEHSRAQTGVLDLLRWTHQAVRDLSGWCERLPGRSRKLLSELKGWAKNPSPSQRMESLLQSREDSGTISEWRDQENRENAVLPAPRSDTPSLDESPILLSRLTRSKRRRHWPRLAPCFPLPRRSR